MAATRPVPRIGAPSTGANPARLAVEVQRPADFEEYWANLDTAVARIPLAASFERLPGRSTDDVDVYDCHYTSLDELRIAAWYCVPARSDLQPPYPGLVLSPGYISEPVLPKSWARLGYAVLSLAPRGKLRSHASFNPGYPGLLVHNIIDRDTYSYRGFYLDALRGLDALLTRPEVDAGRIGVHGGSQGGALSIVLAALRAGTVRCSAPSAPYLCGIAAATRLTRSYPYEEINEYLRAHPDHRGLVERAVSYFDGVNFAPMIRCPTLVTVGLVDDVCPPETGFALHDALGGPKQLLALEGCAHDAGSYWLSGEVERFLAGHLGPGDSPMVEAAADDAERSVAR